MRNEELDNKVQRKVRFAPCTVRYALNRVLGTWHLALALLLSACANEMLQEPDSNGPGNGDSEFVGDCLAFKMEFDSEFGTREATVVAGDRKNSYDINWENNIDVQDKFRIFFFTKEGDFLFGAIDRTVTSAAASSSGSTAYYIRVPMNYLVDRSGEEYDLAAIKDYLRNNDFKVAVLANWPNYGRINPADPDDVYDSAGNPIENGETMSVGAPKELKGEPNWGVKNSVFYTGEGKKLKNINDLHHLEDDGVYTTDANKQAYGFIMDSDYNAGESVDWVQKRDTEEGWNANKLTGSLSALNYDFVDLPVTNKEEAAVWIRENWCPNVEVNEAGIYRHYKYLWKLWDFDAIYRSVPVASDEYLPKNRLNEIRGTYPYDESVVGVWAKDWYFRNGPTIKYWMNNISTTNLSMKEGDAEAGFSFNGTAALYTNNGKTGVKISAGKGTFSFIAHSSGTLTIKYGGAGGNGTLNVKAYNNTESGMKETTYSVSGSNTYTEVKDLSITGNSQTFEIWCSSGSVVIYSIEYIRSKYFYDTDREGIMPSKDKPIPMYGVQNFGKLNDTAKGSVWEEGTTFDLSQTTDADNYDRKTIWLLRSVAKVVVRIPYSMGTVKHIYMRSANRTSRCEPMDVETPTDQLWNNRSHDKNAAKSSRCDFFNIIEYGTQYTTSASNWQDYLSWFYGTWANASWHKPASGNNYTGWSNSQFKPSGTIPYPVVFNPMVNRSDFIHFVETTENSSDGYQEFVLYVPDKAIDDPGTINSLKSTSKVQHIEFRIEGQKENSLDDNDCYRIYFTDYATNPNIGNVTNENFDKYERNTLTDTPSHPYLWPIVRNHKYIFELRGAGPGTPQINVKVTEWNSEKIIVDM